MELGEVGVFMALGGNFVSAMPDTDRISAGLARCGLTVSVSTKVNRTHLYPGTRVADPAVLRPQPRSMSRRAAGSS